MKIAIIGTHSTGKTSIIQSLQEHLQYNNKKILILQELARECPYPINEKTTIKAQKWILDNQIKKENEINHTNNILITDRASLDNFAYMYRAHKEKNLHDFEKKAVEHMKNYDAIFKTQKLEIDAQKDKIRSTDYEFRDNIDWIILHLLEKHNIKYQQLTPSLNTDTHTKFILKYISNLYN
jgi:nicotinamide riboside kinase